MSIWRSHSAAARRYVLRVFGQPATYTPSGGAPVTVTVVLDESVSLSEGDAWQVQTTSDQITADSQDVPDPGKGDIFEVDGTTYEVRGKPPVPGAGGLRIIPVYKA